MKRFALLALVLIAFAPMLAHAQVKPKPFTPAPTPAPVITPQLPSPTLTPSIPTFTPAPVFTPPTPIPTPGPVGSTPPPPVCKVAQSCRDEVAQCLADRATSAGYSVQWSNGRPKIVPNPKEDDAYQAADDCADNLRQCLTGC